MAGGYDRCAKMNEENLVLVELARIGARMGITTEDTKSAPASAPAAAPSSLDSLQPSGPSRDWSTYYANNKNIAKKGNISSIDTNTVVRELERIRKRMHGLALPRIDTPIIEEMGSLDSLQSAGPSRDWSKYYSSSSDKSNTKNNSSSTPGPHNTGLTVFDELSRIKDRQNLKCGFNSNLAAPASLAAILPPAALQELEARNSRDRETHKQRSEDAPPDEDDKIDQTGMTNTESYSQTLAALQKQGISADWDSIYRANAAANRRRWAQERAKHKQSCRNSVHPDSELWGDWGALYHKNANANRRRWNTEIEKAGGPVYHPIEVESGGGSHGKTAGVEAIASASSSCLADWGGSILVLAAAAFCYTYS